MWVKGVELVLSPLCIWKETWNLASSWQWVMVDGIIYIYKVFEVIWMIPWDSTTLYVQVPSGYQYWH